MTNDNSKKPPLGDRVRQILEPLLDAETTHGKMYAQVNKYFESMSRELPPFLERSIQPFFNTAANKDLGMRNFKLIRGITFVDSDEDDEKAFPIVIRIPLAISNEFTNFSADEIRKMPGYIKLHEVARDMNFAIRFTGLTAEDKNSGHTQCVLHANLSVSYEAGLMANQGLNPDLPPKPIIKDNNDKKGSSPSGTFNL